jgi:hypothetical protein
VKCNETALLDSLKLLHFCDTFLTGPSPGRKSHIICYNRIWILNTDESTYGDDIDDMDDVDGPCDVHQRIEKCIQNYFLIICLEEIIWDNKAWMGG